MLVGTKITLSCIGCMFLGVGLFSSGFFSINV